MLGTISRMWISRVCCVYVEAPIVYVGVCCVYVENTHFPRIYRRFQQNPCMLRQFLYSELEKDRFCMAKPMVLDSNTYGFRLQYLWFQAPIPTLLERKIIGIRNGLILPYRWKTATGCSRYQSGWALLVLIDLFLGIISISQHGSGCYTQCHTEQTGYL